MIGYQVEFLKRILKINKVSKSSKGLSSIGYSVLTVVGDGRGSVGFGKARSKDQNLAVNKSFLKARKKIFRISLRNNTIYHEVIGKHGSTIVLLIPSNLGSKISAGGCVKFIFYVIGIKNIICKIYGSSNPYNVVKAITNAFKNLSTPMYIAKKRDMFLKDICSF